MTRTIRCAIGALLVLCLCARAAAGAGDPFKEHYDEALRLYEAGQFEASIPEFQAAYEVRPVPGLLFNIGQAQRKLGHYREALDAYRRYQKEEPNLTPRVRQRLDEFIIEAREKIITEAATEQALRRLREQQAARPPVPGSPDDEPPPEPLEPEPEPLVAPLPALPPQALPGVVTVVQPVKTPLYKRWWLWTAVGAVVAAGVVTAVVVTQTGQQDLLNNLDPKSRRTLGFSQ